MLSKSCTYGLRATLYLAARGETGYVSIKEISRELEIPYSFLTKVLQGLTQHGLLKSLRGPRGGVALSRPPAEVTLRDIIEAIDGPALFTECVLGLPNCGSAKPCPLHEKWQFVRGGIHATLSDTTVTDMADKLLEWSGYGLTAASKAQKNLALNKTKIS